MTVRSTERSAAPPRGALSALLRDYRNVAAIVVALGILQAGASALSAFVPLTLLSHGETAFSVALVSTCYAGGFLVGALRATASVRAIGHIRAFAGFAATGAILVLALYGFPELAAWMLVQALIGLCMAALLTTGESWVADVAPRERRGAIVSYYLVISKAGQIAGPIALVGLAPAHPAAFMAIAAALAGSLVPVCATRRTQPQAPSVKPFGIREAWATAPAAVLASFAAGVVNGSVLQLYPLYAVDNVATTNFGRTASFNAALAFGALIAQWPAGAISDRIDRRIVICALAGLGALFAAGLGVLRDTAPWPVLLALAALWGAGSMSFYGVAVAHAADRAEPGQTTGMMSGILVVWAIGALSGPLLFGAAIDSPLGRGGLFVATSLVLACLSLTMVMRRAATPAAINSQKAPFSVAPATSPTLAILDPRTDEQRNGPHPR